jgi:hypothetical protein
MNETNEKNFIEFNKLKFIKEIGSGGYSTVYSGLYEENSETTHNVAIKQIQSEQFNLSDYHLLM